MLDFKCEQVKTTAHSKGVAEVLGKAFSESQRILTQENILHHSYLTM
jgi:hypothetical protein